MLIKSIRMSNFRQYINSCIEFSCDKTKNVTIVKGDNGAGKTTLAQAFLWCLYGDTDFRDKEVLNRKVRDNIPQDGKNYVTVTLEIVFNGIEYTITRTQEFNKKVKRVTAGNENFSIHTIEDGNTKYITGAEQKYLIKNMLPKELSRFFFFDGEQIRVMSEEIDSGKSSDFKEAVTGLVGLVGMQNALRHLKPSGSNNTVIGYYNRRIDADGDKKLKEYSKEIIAKEEKAEYVKGELSKVELQLKEYEARNEMLREKIFQANSSMEIKRRYEKAQKNVEKLENQKPVKINRLLSQGFNRDFYKFAIKALADRSLNVINEIEGEEKKNKAVIGVEADTIMELINRGKCICGEPITEGDSHYKELMSLLDFVPPKSLGTMINETKEKIDDIDEIAKDYYDNYQTMLKDYNGIDDQLVAARNEEIQLYGQLTDTSEGERAKAESERIKKEISRLNELKFSKKNAIETLAKDKEHLEKERGRLVNISSSNEKYLKALTYANALYKKLNAEYCIKEEKTRVNLEKKINEIFPQIYEGGMKIEVNGKYDIKVVVDDDDIQEGVVEKNTAQRYSIIFAFITSVITMAKEKALEDAAMMRALEGEDGENADTVENEGYPLVMDAPLSNFDKTRIEQICTILPNVAKQVIFFIKDTDGDVASEHMSDKIGKSYEIKKVNDSRIESNIEEA